MKTRAISRSRAACEAAGQCSVGDQRYYNFSRQALKNLEHTWGVSVFHYRNDSDRNWSNKVCTRLCTPTMPTLNVGQTLRIGFPCSTGRWGPQLCPDGVFVG